MSERSRHLDTAIITYSSGADSEDSDGRKFTRENYVLKPSLLTLSYLSTYSTAQEHPLGPAKRKKKRRKWEVDKMNITRHVK